MVVEPGLSPAVVVLALVALVAVLAGLGTLLRIAARLFTAPGVVVHEFAHRWACALVGVPVLEVAYFRLGNPPGYVRHARPERYRESFVVSVAPFLVNTVVSFVAFLGFATLAASIGLVDAGASPGAVVGSLRGTPHETLALAAVLCWLGLVVGMQAFPSTGDANTLWSRSRAEWRRSPVVLLGVPVVLVIYVVNLLSRFGADVCYALGLCVAAFYAAGIV